MDMKQYMRSKRWGVFNHYTCWPSPKLSPQEAGKQWNASVDSFNVERLAQTLHEMGAGYYFITMIHGDAYMPAPNYAYESITKMPQGTVCAKRDLVLDLYDALTPYGIDLCLYYNGLSPFNETYRSDCRQNLFGRQVELTQQNTFQKVDADDFLAKWTQPLREFSLRYGNKVKMWWLDSCYDYAGYTEDMLGLYYDALKTGNPDVLIAFNRAELILHPRGGLKRTCRYEEFTCGEANDFSYLPEKGDYDGALTHLLIPIGINNEGKSYAAWGMPGTTHTHEEIKDYVHKVNAVGGIVTLDIAVKPDGSFDQAQYDALKGI